MERIPALENRKSHFLYVLETQKQLNPPQRDFHPRYWRQEIQQNPNARRYAEKHLLLGNLSRVKYD